MKLNKWKHCRNGWWFKVFKYFPDDQKYSMRIRIKRTSRCKGRRDFSSLESCPDYLIMVDCFATIQTAIRFVKRYVNEQLIHYESAKVLFQLHELALYQLENKLVPEWLMEILFEDEKFNLKYPEYPLFVKTKYETWNKEVLQAATTTKVLDNNEFYELKL